jgi:hypothetical protein
LRAIGSDLFPASLPAAAQDGATRTALPGRRYQDGMEIERRNVDMSRMPYAALLRID